MLPIPDSGAHPVSTRLPQAPLCLGFLANIVQANSSRLYVLFPIKHHLHFSVPQPQTANRTRSCSVALRSMGVHMTVGPSAQETRWL